MPEPLPRAASPWLELLEELPGAGVTAGDAGRVALRLHGVAAARVDPQHGLAEGDVLVVAVGADAEVGDLVVWWQGQLDQLALAEVSDGYRLDGVAGFPAPILMGSGAAQRG